MFKKMFSVPVLLLILLSVSAYPIIQQINFQGRLTTSAGVPIKDSKIVDFTLWPTATGGADPTESDLNRTIYPDNNGVFNVLLNFHPSSFDGNDRYLQVQVVGDSAMTPRQLITAVPYAYRAITAETVVGGVGGPWTTSGSNIYNSNTGNVGIGTTDPTGKLQVTTLEGAAPSIFVDAGTGYVGIGATPAMGKLHVSNAGNKAGIFIYQTNGSGDGVLGYAHSGSTGAGIAGEAWVSTAKAGGRFVSYQPNVPALMAQVSASGNKILSLRNSAQTEVVSVDASGNMTVAGTIDATEYYKNGVPLSTGGVTDVTASSPLSSSGGATPNITIDNNPTFNNLVLTGNITMPAEFFIGGGNHGALGSNSIVIGQAAKCSSAPNAVAIGLNAQAVIDGVAIGNGANTNNSAAVAIGKSATATGIASESVAIGYSAIAGNAYAVSLGSQSSSNGSAGGIAIGYGAKAPQDGIAIGPSAVTDGLGYRGIAIGRIAKAKNNYSIAIGDASYAPTEYSVALGKNASTESNYEIALGTASNTVKVRGTLEANGQVKITGGALGAGKVLTDVAGDGLASWQTPAAGGITGSGTTGKIPKFTGSTAVGDSMISDDGTKLTVSGTLEMSNGKLIMPAQFFIGAGNHGTLNPNAILIGNAAQSNQNSIAIGNSAQAMGNPSIAIGNSAYCNMPNNIAIGTSANAQYMDAIAIGNSSAAGRSQAIAIGVSAVADQQSTTAIGYGAQATRDSGIAIGTNSSAGGGADNYNATAVGIGSKAIAQNALALGAQATAIHQNSVAIGYQATTESNNEIALGKATHNVIARGKVGIGTTNPTSQLTVAGTIDATDYYLNGAPLTTGGTDTLNDVLARGNTSTRDATLNNLILTGNISMPAQFSIGAGDHGALGANVIAIGNNATNGSGDGNIAIGSSAFVAQDDQIAIGSNSFANGDQPSVAIGKDARANWDSAIAIGPSASAGGSSQATIAIGKNANANGDGKIGAIAFGLAAKANAASSIAIGRYATANNVESVAIGYQATTASNNEIALGTASNNVIARGKVGIGTTNVTSQLTVAGTVDATEYYLNGAPFSGGGGNFVSKTGDTMSGDLTVVNVTIEGNAGNINMGTYGKAKWDKFYIGPHPEDRNSLSLAVTNVARFVDKANDFDSSGWIAEFGWDGSPSTISYAKLGHLYPIRGTGNNDIGSFSQRWGDLHLDTSKKIYWGPNDANVVNLYRGGNNQLKTDGSFVAVGTLEANGQVKITSGASLGKVLTSDNNGFATWQTPAAGGLTQEADTLDTVLARGNTSTRDATVGTLSISSEGMIKSGPDRFISRRGSHNTFVGLNAGNLTLTGSQNTGIGDETFLGLTNGFNNAAIGYQALKSLTTGYNNAAVGTYALYSVILSLEHGPFDKTQETITQL